MNALQISAKPKSTTDATKSARCIPKQQMHKFHTACSVSVSNAAGLFLAPQHLRKVDVVTHCHNCHLPLYANPSEISSYLLNFVVEPCYSGVPKKCTYHMTDVMVAVENQKKNLDQGLASWARKLCHDFDLFSSQESLLW
jgi:hypothetical protein